MMLPPDLPEAVGQRVGTLMRFVYGLGAITLLAMAAWQYAPTRHIAQAMFAGGAVFAVVLGLAAQGTLGNPIAGFVLTLAQPIRVGDRVIFSGHDGHVVRIGVSYTRIDVGDGTHVEVPNSLLAQQVVIVERARPSHDGQAPPT